MKTYITILILSAILINISKAQTVGVSINDAVVSPNTNSILDVDISTNNKGILIPRLTTTQRLNNFMGLGATEKGLTVFDETTNSYWFWDGTAWVNMDSDWKLEGNSGTSPATDFIGTTDQTHLYFKTNNTLRFLIDDNANNIGIGSDFSLGDPEANIEIRESFGRIKISAFNNYSWADGSSSPQLRLQRSRGTTSAPLTIIAGDFLGTINFMGGNNYNVSGTTAAAIRSISGSDWDVTKSADLRFYTSISSATAAERMIISTDGYVGIGTSAPSSLLEVNGEIRTSNDINGMLTLGRCDNINEGGQINFTGAGSYASWCQDIAGNNMRIFSTDISADKLQIFGTTTTIDIEINGSYLTTSDKRLKTNIKDLDYGLSTLMKMHAVTYKKHIATEIINGNIKLEDKGINRFGFIAQDLYELIPEIVSKPKDDSKEFWSVDYSKISVIAVKAIQEQQKQIIELKKQNKEILERLKKLEAK